MKKKNQKNKERKVKYHFIWTSWGGGMSWRIWM